MNSEIPVFGSVNRRRVEEVLALWSGRAGFSIDAVAVDCNVVVRRERVGFCSVEIAPYVDPPVDTIVLITDSGHLRCDPAVAVDEVYRAHCGVVRFGDGGPWEVTVTAEGESAVAQVTAVTG
ncbi:MAG: hypothetical protein HZA58_06645 [Acidimicrobiia bacterium]|nr:hypothetical protein [Acidimicrobiia bacterium]